MLYEERMSGVLAPDYMANGGSPSTSKENKEWLPSYRPDIIIMRTSSVRKAHLKAIFFKLFEEVIPETIVSEVQGSRVEFAPDDIDDLQAQLLEIRNGGGELKQPISLGEFQGVEVIVWPTEGETDTNDPVFEATNKAGDNLDGIVTQFPGKRIWFLATDIVGTSDAWDETVQEHFPGRQVPEALGKPIHDYRDRGRFDGILPEGITPDGTPEQFEQWYLETVLAPDTKLRHRTGISIIDEHGEIHSTEFVMSYEVDEEHHEQLEMNAEAGLGAGPNQLFLMGAVPIELIRATQDSDHEALLQLLYLNGWPSHVVSQLFHRMEQSQLQNFMDATVVVPGKGLDARMTETPVDFAQMRLQIWEMFLSNREVVRIMDKNVFSVLGLILSEIEEAEAESNANGLYSPELHRKELVDIIFFIESLGISAGIEFNYDQVATLMQFVTSPEATYYDAMKREVEKLMDNLSDHEQLTQGFEKLLAIIYAHMFSLEQFVQPELVLHQVLVKNNLNYPAEYLSGMDEMGVKLSPADMVKQYKHAVACLKMIRKATGNDTNGLSPYAHRQFADLIKDWRNSHWAQIELDRRLKTETIPQLSGEILVYDATAAVLA